MYIIYILVDRSGVGIGDAYTSLAVAQRDAVALFCVHGIECTVKPMFLR